MSIRRRLKTGKDNLKQLFKSTSPNNSSVIRNPEIQPHSPTIASNEAVFNLDNSQTMGSYPTILDTSFGEGSLTDEGSANIRKVGFEGLKIILKTVERATDVFPPLKSAVAGLLGVIDVVESTFKNEKDLDDLRTRLQSVVSIVDNHIQSRRHLPSFTHRLEGLLIAINHQLFVLRRKKERNVVQRVAEGYSDASEIAEVYRGLAYLFDAFTMDTALSTEMMAQKLLSHALLDKLSRTASAAYNASSPTHRNGCTDKTRESILSELVSWATDSTKSKIYWLNGMAGTGKTTIAYTFCEILDKNHMLGASFFCSRSDDATSNVKHILPTIAYQLALRFPSVQHTLQNIIQQDPEIAERNLLNQFREIILAPLSEASEDLLNKLPVIVFEALDECSDQKEVEKLLSLISQSSPSLPVKFFITSRPERHIRQSFNRSNVASHSKFILHDVEKDLVKSDIERYTRARLSAIADGRSDFEGSLDEWPPENQLKALVDMAGNLFIYAATACAYVDGGGNIQERLSLVMNIRSWSNGHVTTSLDALYTSIITGAYSICNPSEREDIKLVLRALVNVHRPLSICALGGLLGITTGRVKSALSSLHSVIHIPSSGDLNDPVSALHSSFIDYIMTPSRAGDSVIEPFESHQYLAIQSLALMNSSLTENVCQLEGQMNNDKIPPTAIRDRISDALAYACTYWLSHVIEMTTEDIIKTNFHIELLSFFDGNTLRWIECLSLIGQLRTVLVFLRRLETRVKSLPELLNAVNDTRRFVTENFEVISRYSLEVYGSALVWLPEKSRFWDKYAINRNRRWKLISGARANWNACEAVLRGHSEAVYSVAISPDGGRIVSGSHETVVRVWNLETGESEAELVGHTSTVHSVIFSPDGSHIASGSHDKTARIWDAMTGELKTELVGHNGTVYSVAFSPDGSHIASGSNDKTIRIWNVASGETELKLEGHSNSVECVAFSPDGTLVMSGSVDNTVMIWNVAMGESLAKLTGHTGRVTSVAFSPGGERIVSGSQDKKVRIWKAATGELEEELGGHSNTINSVAFSPDGSRVASGSDDKMVCIWNTMTREIVARFSGHTWGVTSIIFTPDNSRIVSGSHDKTVRVWDAMMGESEFEDQTVGHSDVVNALAFSADGSLVASGSYDTTVRIWNTGNGQPEAELMGHLDAVIALAFSSDGTRIASGSLDKTLRVWKTRTGKLEAELIGHSDVVTSVAFSPDDNLIVSGSWDQTVRIWNSTTWNSTEIAVSDANKICSVESVAFSPDGNRIACGLSNCTIRIWNVETKILELETLPGHSDAVNHVAFSPDGNHIISRSSFADTSIQIWNAWRGVSEGTLAGVPNKEYFTSFSPDSHISRESSDECATLSDGTAIFWDRAGFQIAAPHSHSSSMAGPYLFIERSPYIRHRGLGDWCWIPPQFRQSNIACWRLSKIAFTTGSGTVVIMEFSQ